VRSALVPVLALAGAWTAAALWVHLRGRERLSFMRQVADHSTFLAPYNAFIYLRSAVPNRPMLRVDELPVLDRLQANWQVIREEALALWEAGDIRRASKHDDLAFNSFFKRDWRRFYLKWYGDFLPSARARCPRTVALLADIPSIHAAMFAVLAPHSHLVRHRDPFAGSLRYHLGLWTPNDDACRILVDGIPYVWRDGEGVLFDETYIHRAENRTDQPRIILFCDVERPLRDRVATAINRFAIHRVMPATQTANTAEDQVGVANRVFERVYIVRLAMKQLKKRSRVAYYTLSYAAKLSPILLLLWLALRRWGS
jgi:beta-hydroxylase